MKSTAAAPTIEFRLRRDAAEHTCPLCDARFHSRPGILPFLAGTDSVVCCGPGCPAQDAQEAPRPCSSVFEFVDLSAASIAALRATPEHLDVAERLRLASLQDSLPDEDRTVLQCAAIDLQFCEADGTRIRTWEPRLVLETCGEAAAELLLSGCGELV